MSSTSKKFKKNKKIKNEMSDFIKGQIKQDSTTNPYGKGVVDISPREILRT